LEGNDDTCIAKPISSEGKESIPPPLLFLAYTTPSLEASTQTTFIIPPTDHHPSSHLHPSEEEKTDSHAPPSLFPSFQMNTDGLGWFLRG